MTYTLIDSVTLATSATQLTFSSIPAGGDCVLVVAGASSTGALRVYFQVNGDTGNNYNTVRMSGDGSSSSSQSLANQGQFLMTSEGWMEPAGSVLITQFMDYSATDKHKSLLTRTNTPSRAVEAFAQRWASTSAITSIRIYVSNDSFAAGTVFSIYDIAKAL